MATLGFALFPEYPFDRIRRLASLCEELNYRNLWVPDERFWRELGVSMSQVILATNKVKVGSAVTDPYVRHPALTAQMMATLDELSKKRVVVGIGAGIAGFKAMGIRREKPVLAVREAVELMRLLWQGDEVNYHGKLTEFHESHLDFQPVRSRIPIYIAGRGPLMLTLAGRLGDGAMIGSLASPQGLKYAFERITIGLSQAKRDRSDIQVALWLHTAVSEDRNAAEDAVKTIVAGALISSLGALDKLGIDVPIHVQQALQGVTYGVGSPEMQEARSLIGPDLIRHFAVAGTPEECQAQIRSIVDVGVDHIAILPWLVPDQTLEEFARLVMQAFQPVLGSS